MAFAEIYVNPDNMDLLLSNVDTEKKEEKYHTEINVVVGVVSSCDAKGAKIEASTGCGIGGGLKRKRFLTHRFTCSTLYQR
jgi:hypothetical protein